MKEEVYDLTEGTGLTANFITTKEFGVAGGSYRKNTKLCLGEGVREDWVRRGFGKVIGEEATAKKVKKAKATPETKQPRSVAMNTAVTP